MRFLISTSALVLLAANADSAELSWVRVADDGRSFVLQSGEKFIPWGFNYDHEDDGRLIEDYWDDRWDTVVSAFREMKQLGANVVRIHLQFGTFMEDAATPRQASLKQLARLVKLAEETGLYLDLTGLGCYHKPDVPAWYDELDEQDRWAAQAVFWEAVARTCAKSPAVFCYDLMNEPVVPGGAKKRDDWLGKGFGDKFFVQFIALETRGRPRHEIAKAWISNLVRAIRKHDRRHLVTVGMVPWSLDRPGLTSGFVPEKVAGDLDFIAMHIYPEKGKLDEALATVKGFAEVGKPVVIEEIFTLRCGAEELGRFIDRSREYATGWIGFYWGKTPDEYRPPKTIGEALTLSWLELFQEKRAAILQGTKSAAAVPRTVEDLWSDYDPRAEPLEAKTVRQWERDGIVYRYVTFHVGRFKDRAARMAAFYAFPQGGSKLPGLLHLHGGGQRAFQHEVEYYARRGYACLSINWGGREMENAESSDPNTAWGAVDPTQQNVPGYFNLLPGEKYLDSDPSPRNNNWYLLTIGARRGLTFLEQQPEVDPERLGVYGHSMGGNLTVYVAGTDRRVKVAAPSVGGQGFRTAPWKLLPQQNPRTPNGDVELFRATLGFQSYAPHVRAPLLWLGATNDFHGIMDDTYRTGELMPIDVRYAFAPHLNHRFTPEFAVTRPLWIDQHLKGGFQLPATPESQLILATEDGVPRLQVQPDSALPVERVQIMYSIDPDPQARFWRTAEAARAKGAWSAPLPLLSTQQPLFAFANVHYRLDEPVAVQFAEPTSSFALSSLLHAAAPDELRRARVKATDEPSLSIDDFAHGWRDWYRLAADNPHHWQYWTRKIADPKWRGRDGYRLSLDVQADQPNELVVIVTENFFRPYRGQQRDFVAKVALTGGDDRQTVTLSPADFATMDAKHHLESWRHADLLGLRAYHQERRGSARVGSDRWQGPQPEFANLCWVAPKARSLFGNVRCEGSYPHHLQGICTDDRSAVYWSFTTTLVKTDPAGKVLKRVEVANHHGDLCHHDGKLYVAVNLGRFNDPEGNADSWVYVYDADDLSLVAKHETQEVFHGAGGIGFRAGRFYVVGGLPDGVQENYVYEYDDRFRFVKKHVINSGHTHLGIQTAAFANDRWWFGCYGDPKILLVTDANFKLQGRYEFDCSLGVTGLPGGRLLAASGRCETEKGCIGSARPAVPDDDHGLRPLAQQPTRGH